MEPEYIAHLEQAVLAAEHYIADLAASRRKGYDPRAVVFAAASDIRARRRANPAADGTKETQ